MDNKELAKQIVRKLKDIGTHNPMVISGVSETLEQQLDYSVWRAIGKVIESELERSGGASSAPDAAQREARLRTALRLVVDTLDAEEMGEGPQAKDWTASWHSIHEICRAALREEG